MLISLVCAGVFGYLFLTVGLGIYYLSGPRLENSLKTETARLTGIAATFGLAAISFQLSFPPAILLATLVGLSMAGLPLLVATSRGMNLKKYRTLVRVRSSALLSSGFYAVIMQGSFSNVWTYRTGPDAFGWSGAALAICRGDTLASLTQRVQNQLQGTEMIASFARPVAVGDVSIAQIPSFSDQVAAEFLIGAHRTGLPKFLGDVCSLTGEVFYPHLFVALIVLTAYVLTRIIRVVGIEFGLAPRWADLIAIVAVISVGPLSVTLEGGYGQFITLPFFVLAIAALQRKVFDVEAFIFSLALMSVAALSSYLDLLYLAMPMLFGVYLAGLVVKHYPPLKVTRRTAFLTLGSVLLSLPMLGEVARLASSAAGNPRAGGWHQGRFFWPDNIFGVFSNLPVGQYQIIPRTFFDFGADIVLSLLVLGLLIIAPRPQRFLGLFLLFGYAFLTYTVYSDPDDPNNYRLWKYSAYAATLFSFVLIGVADGFKTRRGHTLSRRASRRRDLKIAGVLLVAISSGLSSLAYAADWRASSSFIAKDADAKLIRATSPRYDLAFGPGLYSTMYTMYGDLRFGTSSRGGPEIGPVIRNPKRPLAVILRNEIKPTLEILNASADGVEYTRFTVIARGDTITAYHLTRN